MRNPGGYYICTPADGSSAVEIDTFTCRHCNGVVFVKPKQNPDEIGGYCRRCAGMICPRCVARDVCDPSEAKLQRLEQDIRHAQARDVARRSYGLT